MIPKLYFIMVHQADGSRLLGITAQPEYDRWVNGQSPTLEIANPKMFMIAPTSAQNSVQIMVQPMYPAKTKQERLVTKPIAVDRLGELKQIGSGMECDDKELYPIYADAVQRWKANLSGVLAPTQEDVLRVNNVGTKA